jgi:hypothetical protein
LAAIICNCENGGTVQSKKEVQQFLSAGMEKKTIERQKVEKRTDKDDKGE